MTSIQNLSASNGDGEAVKANVTATRSIGVTTLQVDSVTNWPTNFIATSGVLNGETGYLDPATMVIFNGHLSGVNIIIDSFANGYSDLGNAVADVVILKPTTAWVDALVDVIKGLYPVGCVYTETTGVNPATTFGFGTWVAWGSGRVPVGVDTGQTEFNTVEKTGGHKLLQAHTHSYNTNTNNGNFTVVGGTGMDARGVNNDNTTSTGGGNAQNLPPYITCYMWHRTV